MGAVAGKKIAAATLVEVLVAMVIIMVVFSLAIGIFTRVTGSGPSAGSQQANRQMRRLIALCREIPQPGDLDTVADSIRYNRVVAPYRNSRDVLLVTVTATQRGRVLGVSKALINIHEHGQ
ncbi:type II secretion system protein [Hufsiella ginkgonis]|uniref:Type II secretion system protein n=1 Tax=Hufsiella ginkgonis TaxID=2695274 RepID=A0A7K1XXV1_9SPHI|nr:hypothetical protein [Hufsiella ginkgonis]MXV15763.1 hypothetical protein [Hufsiella ginkgonis]